MAQEKKHVIGGIAFPDAQSAGRATEEAKRIEALNANINYDNLKSVFSLYRKAQANHVFQTPVGINYMLQLQARLLELGVPLEEIPPIDLPLPQEGAKAGDGDAKEAGAGTARDEAALQKEDQTGAKKKKGPAPGQGSREGVLDARIEAQKKRIMLLQGRLKMQWAIIIAMAVIILAMFLISLTGNNPTILNYRSKIINQYSDWEKELEEREAALLQKERQEGYGETEDSGGGRREQDAEAGAGLSYP